MDENTLEGAKAALDNHLVLYYPEKYRTLIVEAVGAQTLLMAALGRENFTSIMGDKRLVTLIASIGGYYIEDTQKAAVQAEAEMIAFTAANPASYCAECKVSLYSNDDHAVDCTAGDNMHDLVVLCENLKDMSADMEDAVDGGCYELLEARIAIEHALTKCKELRDAYILNNSYTEGDKRAG